MHIHKKKITDLTDSALQVVSDTHIVWFSESHEFKCWWVSSSVEYLETQCFQNHIM